MLDAAGALGDLRYPPGNRLERLGATAKASTAFVLTINIESALYGEVMTHSK